MSEVREMTVKEMLGLVDAKLIDDTYFMVKLG